MLHALAIETVRRNNRYLLILSGIVLGVSLLMMILSSRYYYNLLLGPFEVSATELAANTYEHPLRYWYRVRGEPIIDTGYEFSQGEGRGRRVQSSYAAAQFPDSQLLIQLQGDLIGTPRSMYEGFLIDVSTTVRRGVIEPFLGTEANPQTNFLPVMLHVRPLGGWGYAGFILNAVGLVIGLVGVGMTLYRNSHPQSHPMLKALGRWGDAKTTLAQIDAELQEPHQTIGNLHLTRNWVISQSPTTLEVMRFDEIVWVYKKMTDQTGYSVLIHDRHGKVIAQRAKELRANEIVALIHQRVPGAITTYDRDTESAWRRGTLKTTREEQPQA